jgi:Uma2 family endonuclease
LVAGEVKKMTPPGWKHGVVVGRLSLLLTQFVEQHDLGLVLEGDAGFVLAREPDTVRAPDYAFIRKDRLPAEEPEEAYWPGPPDLAVEVISPGDTVHEIDDEVKAWLDAGTLMVWVVNPKSRSVTVYRSATNIKTLAGNEELSGEDVVAGFRCRVRDVFARRT